MNIFKISSALGLWLLVSAALAQSVDTLDTRQPMDLEACLAYAFANNTVIENSKLDQRIARTDVGVTKSQGLPQLSAAASYDNNYIIQTQFLPAEFFAEDPTTVPENAPAVPVDFGVPHTGRATASLTQMIFDGSYFIGLKAARVYSELAAKNVEQSKVVTAEQVTKAYYTTLINQDRQQLLSSNFQRLDTLLRETELMFESGFAEKIDVGRVKVQYNNAKTELEQNKRLTEVSYLLLKFQMGMPLEQDIALADKISDVEFSYEFADEANFKYNDRAEFAQIQINRDLTQLDLRNNRIQYLPKLTANANFGYNSGVSEFNEIVDFDRNWFEFGSFGFNLNIPIFDGLRKHHTIQKSKLQLQQLENQADFLKNQIDLEIVQARVNLQNNLETLEVQQENLELAQEVFDVTKIKYQEGVGSNLEVTEAQNALQSAETNYYNALYSALIARVDLKRALGTLVDTPAEN
jgi:outer membrane protein TolC